PSSSVRSQAHTSSQPCAATCDNSWRRVGSANALNMSAVRSAWPASFGKLTREQHGCRAANDGFEGSAAVFMPAPYLDIYLCVRIVSTLSNRRISMYRVPHHHGRCHRHLCGDWVAGHAGDVLLGSMLGRVDHLSDG